MPDPLPDGANLTEQEIIAALRTAMSSSGRLSRLADVYIATICADHLVRELRGQGLAIVRRLQGG